MQTAERMTEEEQNERRRRLRHDVSVQAMVTGIGRGQAPCVVKDVSRTGLFMSLVPVKGDGPRTVQIGMPIVIEFEAVVDGVRKRARLPARIARVLSSGVGVRFAKLEPDALSALQAVVWSAAKARYAAEHGSEAGDDTGEHAVASVAAGAPAPHRAADSAAVVAECTGILGSHAPRIASLFLRVLGGHLHTAHKDARHPHERKQLDAAVITLNDFRTQFADAIINGLQAEFERFVNLEQGPGPPLLEPPPDESGLSLVGTDRLDDVLSYAEVVDYLNREVQPKVYELTQRLAHVAERPLREEDNPLSPETVCRVISDAIRRRLTSTRVHRFTCETLRDNLGSQLSDLYDDLNQAMIQRGILPVLKPKLVIDNVKTTRR